MGQLTSEEETGLFRKVTGGGQRSLKVGRQGLTCILAEVLILGIIICVQDSRKGIRNFFYLP